MAYVPRGGNQTGGRGRGRGGGPAPRGKSNKGGQAPPLATQLRQLDRLQEPEEMAVLRRYKDIGACQVRSSYGVGGLLDRQVQIPDPTEGGLVWVSVAQADNALQQKKLLQERERALARQGDRLPEDRRRRSWSQLAPEDRRVLLLSQKEWNSFRARALKPAQPPIPILVVFLNTSSPPPRPARTLRWPPTRAGNSRCWNFCGPKHWR
jgi:hypothetical protein